jgi:hypothetical protein
MTPEIIINPPTTLCSSPVSTYNEAFQVLKTQLERRNFQLQKEQSGEKLKELETKMQAKIDLLTGRIREYENLRGVDEGKWMRVRFDHTDQTDY